MQIAREGILSRWSGLFALVAVLISIFAIAARHVDTTATLVNTATAADLVDCAPSTVRVDCCASHLEITHDPDWLAPPELSLCSTKISDARTDVCDQNAAVAEFDVARHGGMLLVPVAIGGHEYQFLVDTGCTYCVVDCELKPILHATGETATLNGRGKFDVYSLPRTFVGKYKVPVDGPVICLDLEPFRECSGYEIRGILGMTFLKQHIIRIDFDAGKLAFFRACPANAGHCFHLSYTKLKTPALSLNVGQDHYVSFELDTGCYGSYFGHFTPETFNCLTQNGQLHDTRKNHRSYDRPRHRSSA